MDIEKRENELKKIEKVAEDEWFGNRKSFKLDFNELKLFTTEVFGNDFERDIIKSIIENPHTLVVVPLHKENNGELKERLPGTLLYATISILDLWQTNSCTFLREHLLNLTQRYSSESFRKTVAKLCSDTKNNLKLLFYERKDYAPPDLCHYLLSYLNYCIENIDNDAHFFYVSKIFKATKINVENQETKSIIWLNTEDHKFAEEATDYFEYPADSSIVSGFPKYGCPFAPDNWRPEDYTNAEPWRRIYLIQSKRLVNIYKKLKDQFG